MEFTDKWRMTPEVEQLFVQRLKVYLFDEILHDAPPHEDADWCKNAYWEIYNSMQTPWRKSCRLPRLRDGWEVSVKRSLSEQQLIEHMKNKELPHRIKEHIKHCTASGKDIVALFVSIWYPDLKQGHATMLFFDLKNKFQWFFDPHDGLNRRICLTRVFSCKPFMEGFTVVPVEYVCESTTANSIQSHFEKLNPKQSGVCGILLVLVLLCCLRFDYWDTKSMSNLVKRAVEQRENEFIQKFISFYLDINAHDYQRKYMFKKMLPPSSAQCCVFNKTTHQLCSNQADELQEKRQYCLEHYLALNIWEITFDTDSEEHKNLFDEFEDTSESEDEDEDEEDNSENNSENKSEDDSDNNSEKNSEDKSEDEVEDEDEEESEEDEDQDEEESEEDESDDIDPDASAWNKRHKPNDPDWTP